MGIYGIMRVEKRNRTAVFGLQLEANRQKMDHERGREFDQSDIEWDQTERNFFLKRTEHWNAEITRQIHEAGVKETKASVVLLDGLYTVSGAWFEGKSDDEIHRFFEACLRFHVNNYCAGEEDRVINAVVHLDERTPHLHVASVPICRDEKGAHLSAKIIMGNRTDYRLRQDRFYEQVARGFGMERGELVRYETGQDGLLRRAENARVHITKREWQVRKQEEKLAELQNNIERESETLKIMAETVKRATVAVKSDRKSRTVKIRDEDYEALLKASEAFRMVEERIRDAVNEKSEARMNSARIMIQAQEKAEGIIREERIRVSGIVDRALRYSKLLDKYPEHIAELEKRMDEREVLTQNRSYQ